MAMSNLYSLSAATIFLAATVLASPSASQNSEINQTTSYAKQTQYYCTLATTDDVKPAPIATDHFRLNNIHRGIADLNGDGTLEMVFGASDETFSLDRVQAITGWPAWVYEGNEARSRQPHQYAFYSPSDDFIAPMGTRYLNARTILTQDFNGDGVDDMAFAIWGTDYEPYAPVRNEILLSSPDGYKAKYLPGSANFGHGATAGDLDNDGDIDIIMTGANRSFTRSRIYRYINDGEGNFTVSTLGNLADSYVVSLYDIDGDKNLDLFLSKIANQTTTIQIYWGHGNGTFNSNPLSIFKDEWLSTASEYKRGDNDTFRRLRHRTFSEPVFADTDNDGKLNIIIPSNMDFHFSLFDLEVEDRKVSGFNEVLRTPEAPNNGMIPSLHWLNACDLGGNGVDLVYEVFGQPFYGNSAPGAELDFSRTDKVVFKNDGEGEFTFYKLENPVYFERSYNNLLTNYSDFLGVSIKSYEPSQVYHPNEFNSDIRFLHPSYVEKRHGAQLFPYNTVPEITSRLGGNAISGGTSAASSAISTSSVLSDRARRILEERELVAPKGTSAASNAVSTPASSAASTSKISSGVLSDRARRILEERRLNKLYD